MLPSDWSPPSIPKLHNLDGAVMSVSPLERPAAGPSGHESAGSVGGWEQSGGGMVVRIATSEVEDMFKLMAYGLRSLEVETGLRPYADRFDG